MDWLHWLSNISLILAALCCVMILLDLLAGNRQKMAIMNLVWPITALYAGPLALWAYYRIGRSQTEKPFWQSVIVAATHCGSGCALGDLVAEWFTVAVPIAFLGHRLFGAWLLDFCLAFVFGIVFQYFSIKPMRDLPPRAALIASLKADTLSLTSWQLGMYGWMALVTFAIFKHPLAQTDSLFWFMMQIAMLAGFVTAFPVNWCLLTAGVKEKM